MHKQISTTLQCSKASLIEDREVSWHSKQNIVSGWGLYECIDGLTYVECDHECSLSVGSPGVLWLMLTDDMLRSDLVSSHIWHMTRWTLSSHSSLLQSSCSRQIENVCTLQGADIGQSSRDSASSSKFHHWLLLALLVVLVLPLAWLSGLPMA